MEKDTQSSVEVTIVDPTSREGAMDARQDAPDVESDLEGAGEAVTDNIQNSNGAGPEEHTDESAASLLRRMAASNPEAVAFADPVNRPAYAMGPNRTVSYREADQLADGIAARLIAHGLKPGDVIAIQMPNFREGMLLAAGAWRARLVPVPLPMSWRLSELHQALAQLDAVAIVATGNFAGDNQSKTMCDAAAHHMTIRYIFGLGDDLCDGVTPISDWFDHEAPNHEEDGDTSPPLPPPAPTDLALMTWASSPAGPYPVPRTHANLMMLARIVSRELQLTGNDVVLSTYPLAGITSFCGLFVAPLLAGATIILHQPFDYDSFVAQIEEHQVTYTALPAAVIDALEERGDLKGAAASLKRIGRIRPWPHSPSCEPSEHQSPVTIFDIHNLAELALIIRPAAEQTGLPLGKFVTPANGADAGGEVYLETRIRGSVTNGGGQRHLQGDLYVRGSMIPAGPFNQAGALTSTLLIEDQQGYINTHIRSTVDENVAGYFRCSSDKAMIYHGGHAIGASELDDIYADFPDFLDAAAFPIDDMILGERIFAAVVPRPNKTPSLSDLRLFLAEKGIAAYKAPDQLVIVNSIPRGSDGKVLREEILEEL